MSDQVDESAELTGAERAELVRLRGELAALRTRRGWRTVTAIVLIVLGCVLAPVSLATVWVHNQIADTDRFVATVSPVIRQPEVQAALTDRVTDAVFGYIDVRSLAHDAVQALVAQGLPPRVADRLDGLTGPLADAVRGFVHSRVGELFASEQFARAWDDMIRVAHEQAVAALSGSDSAVSIRGADVVLDLAPFIEVAKRQLADSGLTAVNAVPDVHPTITVADAKSLVRARSAYTALDRLATWLPWVTLVILAAGVYLARDRRRALAITGLGVAASMVVLAAGILVLRMVIVDSVPSRSVDAAATTYDILVRFLRDGLRTVFALGLVVALGAFLAGPSAAGIRGGVGRAVNWLRERGLRAGRLGVWVHTYRTALRGTAIGLAVLIFVFLDRPSGLTVLVIALLLAVSLVVIQLLDQPAGMPRRRTR